VKDQEYSQGMNALDELKAQITAVIADVTKDMLTACLGCMQSYSALCEVFWT
jgi:hypothetical protein